MNIYPRSAFDKVGGLIYFPRMLDKIRLHAAGKLTTDYRENLGNGFDGRCTRFLKVAYPALRERVLQGGTDEEILAALRASTLADRRNLLDAVPQRFSRALDEASRLLEPKAQRVMLPGATIHNATELDQWLAGVREQVGEKLKEGPVTL